MRKNDKRVKQANARAQNKFKEARQMIRQAKLVEELKALDGVSYESTAFNEDCLNGSRKRKTGTTKIYLYPKIKYLHFLNCMRKNI